MSELDGLILQHRDFGYCKITAHTGSTVRVKFIGTGRDSWYGVAIVAAQKEFKWKPLPTGLKCKVADRGECTIIESPFVPDQKKGVHIYLVTFDGPDELTAKISERNLWPIAGSLVETPISKIISLQPDPINHFRTRNGFIESLRDLNIESGGISALVGSRIELLPHQAYVVTTVVDDPICRFILADEVGLGKTIEAGVIAHQLLADKPDARILVLTPGPLARQWLCELRMSFGGRDFRLLDLHPAHTVNLKKWSLVISSLKIACSTFREQIIQSKWDLVIIDEAHQLLWNKAQYDFVDKLARSVPKLLLLSAVPARERSSELLKLLSLIEPTRYSEGSLIANRFEELYAAQPSIGKRWKLVSRGIAKGLDVDFSQLENDVQRLLSTDVLASDIDLQFLFDKSKLEIDTQAKLLLFEKIADEVVSKYRLSRRILKNRRALLTEQELFKSVERAVEFFEFKQSQIDIEIQQVGIDLLVDLKEKNINLDALHSLARKVLQAFCDPVALYEIACSLSTGKSKKKQFELDLEIETKFDSSLAYDYDEHENLISNLGDYFGPSVDLELLKRWISLIQVSIEIELNPRIKALQVILENAFSDGVKKVLIFAGTPGVTELLRDLLIKKYNKQAVASFSNDLTDDEKETQVAKFKNDAKCAILVSDESGGEGRNFQFADQLIHFDLPWSVSAIEQRIGRLDRVGRKNVVKSVVITPESGIEKQWIQCLHNGFGVFTRSISGLEFMLRSEELRIVELVLTSSTPDFDSLVEKIFSTSEIERASDDAEAITDASSFKSKGNVLRTFKNNLDLKLEQFMPSYMRMISRNESAKMVTDIKDVNLKIWRLRPEDIIEFKLPGMDRDGENPMRERYGSFNRVVARDRFDLEFFSVGHPLVDALTVATHQLVRGRSFFVRTNSPVIPEGIHMLSSWKVYLEQNVDIPEKIKRLLEVRDVTVCFDFHDRTALSEANTQEILRILKSEVNGVTDLSTDKTVELMQPESGLWSESIKEIVSLAESASESSYKNKFSQIDEFMCSGIDAQIEYIDKFRHDESPLIVDSLRNAISQLKNPKLILDTVGFLHVAY
jgi:ATP-dependent helicase HepA